MTAAQRPTALRGYDEYSDVEYVFKAHTTTRPPVREYVGDLWARRQFMKALATASLRGERSSTFLGEMWGVLDPLFQAAIYIFVVAVIRGGRSGGFQTAALIIAGVFLFNYSKIGLNEGGRSILASKGLMLNSSFPRALLPLAEIYKGLLEFLPSIALYVVIHLVTRQPLGQGLFLLPLLFLLQTAMAIGMALLVATATVYVRDTVNLLNYVTRILIFVTPVIYPASSLSPTLRTLLSIINPLFPLFSAYQTIIVGGVPTVGQVLLTTFWATLLLVAGYRVFVSHERAFALRL
jgi:ABC-type polysaccharide/polyol phosphate export permease